MKYIRGYATCAHAWKKRGKGGIRFALLRLPFLKERLLFSKTNDHFARSLFEGNESSVRLVEYLVPIVKWLASSMQLTGK